MMLFSAILFLFAAPTQKICNSLQAPEYNLFSQVSIDYKPTIFINIILNYY